MRSGLVISLVFSFVVAFFCIFFTNFETVDAVRAEPAQPAGGERPCCPPPGAKDIAPPQPSGRDRPNPRPKFAQISHPFDQSDEVAALESVHIALAEVSDGSTYVWHRANGRLSGMVQPTASYRDKAGTICRHLVVMLTSGSRVRKTEGVACREPSGLWRLDG